MTITDRIASLLWDYTIAHNARPTVLRLTREDEQALGVLTCLYGGPDVCGAPPPPRFMGMVIELDAERTEVC
jgi:hypothetical protein